jgi:hypothetical protein
MKRLTTFLFPGLDRAYYARGTDAYPFLGADIDCRAVDKFQLDRAFAGVQGVWQGTRELAFKQNIDGPYERGGMVHSTRTFDGTEWTVQNPEDISMSLYQKKGKDETEVRLTLL